MYKHFGIIFFILLLLPGISLCEEMNGGKYYTIYSRKNYNSQPQNWFITSDKGGIIYSANQGAVLQYDGVSWKEIQVKGKNARSIAIDEKGNIFVGGNNEIGLLTADNRDVLSFKPLTGLVDEKYRDFGYVWRTYATDHGVYFCTTKYLFLYDYEKIKTWTTESSFSPPFICNGKLLVRQQGKGLMEMRNHHLVLLKGGEAFENEKIYAMVPFSNNTLLIGTENKGFFLFKNGTLSPFNSETMEMISSNQLTFGLALKDGNFAFATRKGGIVVVDNRGELKWSFDWRKGLPDSTVWHIFEDEGKNLWLSLDNGIAKIEYGSRFSVFDERQGLKGMILSVAELGGNNELYVGTASGLYVMNEKGIFVPITGIMNSCYALKEVGNGLLAATDKGIFRVSSNHSISTVLGDIRGYVFHMSRKEPLRVLVGTNHGLLSLSMDQASGKWKGDGFLGEINDEIRTMAEDEGGDLWLASPGEGVIRIGFSSSEIGPNYTIKRYGPTMFPPGVETHVFYAAGHIMIATGKGIFRLDKKNERFVPDMTLGEEFAGGKNGKSVYHVIEDKNKNIWIHSNARNMVGVLERDGSYGIYKKEFLRIPLSHVNAIYPDMDRGWVWFGAVDGLIGFDIRKGIAYSRAVREFQTLIRGVWANEVLISGGDTTLNGNHTVAHLAIPELAFNRRSLRFSFAAPFFEGEHNTVYQCRLEGYDWDWTKWGNETRKDYTNLDPGINVFRVRAKNIYGDISSEGIFRFNLLPPWYRTWWAYVLYSLVLILMVTLLVKWRSARLIQEKQHLEGIIGERTKEINEKNKELQEMAKIKSVFFANISHEFRTPLTLILGPLEQMIENAKESGDIRQEKKLKMMERNARRLLNLINELLELSKFDSQKVTLNVSENDMVSFLKGLTASFEMLTGGKDQELNFHSDREEILVYFDAFRMEEVCSNLLFNAVKFTPSGGVINVMVTNHPQGSSGFPQGYVQMDFSDTGPGIPSDRLEKIFDPFYHSENIYEYNQKGAGIGLAIARELVELHHGTIRVESKEGEGSHSRFIICLPLGKDHYQPSELGNLSLSEENKKNSFLSRENKFSEQIGVSLDEEQEKERDENIPTPFSGNEEIILVIEDSGDVCQYIRSALEPEYKVIDSPNGQEGIEKALQVIPDLIISDVMMPGVDGYELCRILKQNRNTSHVPIILLTAKASEENILEGLETGADDYVTKPFSTRILRARIKNLIDLRRQMQQHFHIQFTSLPLTGNNTVPSFSEELNRGVKNLPDESQPRLSAIDREFFKDLHDLIEKNMSDPDFNVDQLARKLYMGRSTVYRKLQALCGENPTDYIRMYRLRKAAQLLQEGTASVTDVAYEVGFNSRTYFTRCFKEMFNRLPSGYKTENKDNN